VLVDNLRVLDEEGKMTETALTPEQLENMTKLVRDAVGFDQSRGDSVNVVNASFKGEAVPEEITEDKIPLWEMPLVRDIAKLVAGLVVLLALVFVVLRPLVRGLLEAPRQAYVPVLPDGTPAQVTSAVAATPGGPAPLDYDAQIAQARSLVAQDPARVAQVVKTWVGNDND
jgi:flagellar M-ring protein FliF